MDFDLKNHQIWWGNDEAIKFWCASNVEDLIARDFSSDTPTVRKRLQQIAGFTPTHGSVQETWTLYPNDLPVTTRVQITPICSERCTVQAIHPTGEINPNECIYCLECQTYYADDHICPPLVAQRKKRERRHALSAGQDVSTEVSQHD